MLAFSEFDDSPEAWARYDKLSFLDLCMKLGVSKRTYDEVFEPMVLTGLFAPGNQCSAAAALGMAYFFVLKHQARAAPLGRRRPSPCCRPSPCRRLTTFLRACSPPGPAPAPPLPRPRAPPRATSAPLSYRLPTAPSRSSPGAIGYIDAGHGHEHGLSEVALLNKDGKYLTTKTADIGAAATVALDQGNLIPTDPAADWSGVNLYNLGGATTWPITMISYFYLEKDLSGMDAQSAALLMAFVKFVLSAEGQAKAEDKLFVKLPTKMQTYNTATLASLTLPAGYAALSVELASDTQIEVGAGMSVISGKRREYGEWDRDRMEAQFESMQATIALLQAEVKSNHDNDDDVSTLSIVALVFGLLAFVLAIVAIIMICMNKSAGKPVQREISFTRTIDEKQGVEFSGRAASSANGAANGAAGAV